MKVAKALGTLGCAALLLGSAPTPAVPVLQLAAAGGPTITIVDGGSDDANPAAGVITYIGAVGPVWTINVTTGLSFSPAAHLDLNSVDLSNAAGILTMFFGDTDFTGGAGPQSFELISAIGGTTDGRVIWRAAIQDANTNPLTPNQLGVVRGPLGPGAFSQTNTDLFSSTDGTFAMQLAVQITHTAAGITSFDYDGRVPEPASLLLLGAGLLGIAAFRRRRNG